MIAIDTNLLIYAHRSGAREHRSAQRAIETAASQNGTIYWTELGSRQGADGSISRANLDGSDIEILVTGLIAPFGLAVDWMENGPIGEPGALRRVDLETGAIEDIVTGLALGEADVAIDADAGKVCWTTATGVQRANLDGSDVEDLVDRVGLAGIALDPAGNRMYWSSFSDQGIRRSTLDGTNVELLYQETKIPHLIALAPG